MKTIYGCVMALQIEFMNEAISDLEVISRGMLHADLHNALKIAKATGKLISVRRTFLEASLADVAVETLEAV